jgi:hypothetical protein
MNDIILFYSIVMSIIAVIVSIMTYQIMYKNPNSFFGGKKYRR